MRQRLRDSTRSGLAVIMAATILDTVPGQAAEPSNAEQIVFSGGATGSFDEQPTGFGFWIWCEGDATNPYAGFCHGAMYFYALGQVKSVSGVVAEPEEDAYQMSVVSSDHSVACMLQNVPPIRHGPVNRVNVTCSAPAGGGTSGSSVVNVTGPPSAD